MIEALTYRLADHTTADDASRYRSDAEVSEHWQREPVARVRALLVAAAGWGHQEEQHLLNECAAEIDAAATDYLEREPLPPTAMFEHLYAELPDAYFAQRTELVRGATDG
jgi:pyruvate dehydrogenase E1 component alpha subunit